jgi:hypothetical protein
MRLTDPPPPARVPPLIQHRCPLVRAALRLGDPAILAAVTRWHPPSRCAAARRERSR